MRDTAGFFISVDGIDGCGKSTQASLLADWCREAGRVVTQVRDPGGTALGESLREILLYRSDLQISMRAEMLLYMSSRAQMVEEIIQPALSRDEVVICDRYLLANVVYQGCGGGLPVDEIWEVGRVATANFQPDLTLLFDLEVPLAMQRVGQQKDRLESRGVEYMEKVRQGYLQQIKRLPNAACIDASLSIENIHEQVLLEVNSRLAEIATAR